MRIGVDLGGTKIEAVALADSGTELSRVRIAAPRGRYSATLGAIASVVRDVEQQARATGCMEPVPGIGIGIPGAVSPATGLVKNANSTWLIGEPLESDLCGVLGRPVRIENDANCFAVSEATDGSAAGAELVFGAILGTGVGAGIVVRGRTVRGRMAIAGEWGHNRLPAGDTAEPTSTEWPGPACYCGRRGCIETFLSGPGLLARHRDAWPAGGSEIESAQALFARAREGDPEARLSVATYIDRLARSLASVINILDPDVIVLGGGLSQVPELYEQVPRVWGKYVFSDRVDTQLLPPKHGDASGVRGAAWLWPLTAGTGSPTA
jgi:fructokinase